MAIFKKKLHARKAPDATGSLDIIFRRQCGNLKMLSFHICEPLMQIAISVLCRFSREKFLLLLDLEGYHRKGGEENMQSDAIYSYRSKRTHNYKVK